MKPKPYSTLEGEGAGWVNRRVTRFLQTVDGGDFRMVQRGQDSGFTLKPGQAFGVIGEEVREDFEGDIPAELGIVGSIDLAHAALADFGGDFIGAEASARAEGHGFPWMCEGEYTPGRDLLGEVQFGGGLAPFATQDARPACEAGLLLCSEAHGRLASPAG